MTKDQAEDCPNNCEFKCPLRVIKDEEYNILVIGITNNYGPEEAYVYYINKGTFEVRNVHYPQFFKSKYFVSLVEMSGLPEQSLKLVIKSKFSKTNEKLISHWSVGLSMCKLGI